MYKDSNIVEGAFERGVFTRMVDKYKAWNERRVAISQLSAMPDRLLKDIGIDRYDISAAVNNSGHFAKLVTRPAGAAKDSLEIQKAA